MASHSAAAPVSLFRGLAAWALPWLCSMTFHSVLLIVLAISLLWGGRKMEHKVSGPAGLQAVFISSGGDDSGLDGEGLAGDGTAERGAAGFDRAAEYFDRGGPFDDQPAPLAQRHDLPREGGSREPSSSTTEPLEDKPAVSLAGSLPTRSVLGGALSGKGGGTGEGSLGRAQGESSQSHGSGALPGGYARTSVFGAMGEGRKFVYVFDRSGSMDGHGGAPLTAAKAELNKSLKNLGQTHQFQIIFYNEHPRIFNPTGVQGRLVFGTDHNKFLAQKFVGSITADGATQHEEALVMALRMAPDVVFFLTDADEPRMSTKELARIAKLNRGTIINAIEFGYGTQEDPDNFLVRLAEENGGQHVYVDVSQLRVARN